jgi:hypothetical protein
MLPQVLCLHHRPRTHKMSDREPSEDWSLYYAYAALGVQALLPIVIGSYASVKVRTGRPIAPTQWPDSFEVPVDPQIDTTTGQGNEERGHLKPR